MTMITDNARSALHSLAMFAFGFSLLLFAIWLGGCALGGTRGGVAATTVSPSESATTERGHVVIRVRIVCTREPCDTPMRAGLNFVAARAYRVLVGAGVQLDPCSWSAPECQPTE